MNLKFLKPALQTTIQTLNRHRVSLAFRLARYTLFFTAAWQLDLVAAGVIHHFYNTINQWIFYVPFGIRPDFPWLVIGWKAGAWSVPDAYVRFFFLLFVGFFLSDIRDLFALGKTYYKLRRFKRVEL